MNNALTLISLLLQSAQQIQSYGSVVQKAIAEGRDVTDEEKAAARAALQGHLDDLQATINAM